MSFEDAINSVPVFVLAAFRTAAMMLSAPLLGSTRIPRRLKGMMALVIAAGLVGGVAVPPRMPATTLHLAVAIGGEIIFGALMGMILSLVFIAVSWAGEIIGQQMGFNLAETFDPQFGQQGSIVGEMYSMLGLIVFLLIRGHHALIQGLADSFRALPLLSVGMNDSLLSLMMDLVTASMILAIKVSAPMLVTMLVVDLALGFIGKTMPQINVMTSGLTLRAGVGMAVLIVGLMLTTQAMRAALIDGLETVGAVFRGHGTTIR